MPGVRRPLCLPGTAAALVDAFGPINSIPDGPEIATTTEGRFTERLGEVNGGVEGGEEDEAKHRFSAGLLLSSEAISKKGYVWTDVEGGEASSGPECWKLPENLSVAQQDCTVGLSTGALWRSRLGAGSLVRQNKNKKMILMSIASKVNSVGLAQLMLRKKSGIEWEEFKKKEC